MHEIHDLLIMHVKDPSNASPACSATTVPSAVIFASVAAFILPCEAKTLRICVQLPKSC